MPRVTRAALIQATNALPDSVDLPKIKQANIDKHVELIQQAAEKGAQVCCLQELFYGPYFPAEQDIRWYSLAEPIPAMPKPSGTATEPAVVVKSTSRGPGSFTSSMVTYAWM